MADSVNDLNDHDMDDVPSIKKEESVSSNGATSVGLSDRDKVQHRKPHQKSRMGCTQCKARRVKCDEHYPSCSNCKRRREHCSYNVSSNGHGGDTPEPSSHESHSSTIAALQLLHISQLELMHQYTTSTYATLVKLPRDQNLAQIEIPRMAIKYHSLLDALFCLTSLHLASERPLEAVRLANEAVRYQTSALGACREGLSNLTASGPQCRAMFHSSAFLGVSAMALHCIRARFNAAPRPSETLLESAELWRGTGLMLHTAQKMLDPETFNSFFPLPDWFTLIGAVRDENAPAQEMLERLRTRVRLFDPSTDLTFQYPPTPTPSPGATGEANHQSPESSAMSNASSPPALTPKREQEERIPAYLNVLDKLSKLFHVRDPETPAILNILIEISPVFLQDLVAGAPLASAIGLMYTVLMRTLEAHWWSKDYQQQLKAELASYIPPGDVELMAIAVWAEA